MQHLVDPLLHRNDRVVRDEVHRAAGAGHRDVALLAVLLGPGLDPQHAQVGLFGRHLGLLHDLVDVQLAHGLAAFDRQRVGHGDGAVDQEARPEMLQEVLLVKLAGTFAVHAFERRLQLLLRQHGVLLVRQLRELRHERDVLRLRHALLLADLLEQSLHLPRRVRGVQPERRDGVTQAHAGAEPAVVRGERRGDLLGLLAQGLQLLDHVGGVLEQSVRHEPVLLLAEQGLLLIEVHLGLRQPGEQGRDDLRHRRVGGGDDLRVALQALQVRLRLGRGARRLVLRGAGLLASGLHGLGRELAPRDQRLRCLYGRGDLLLEGGDLGLGLALHGGHLALGHAPLHLAHLLRGGVEPRLQPRKLLGRRLRSSLGEALGGQPLHRQEGLRTAGRGVGRLPGLLQGGDELAGLLDRDVLDALEEGLLGGGDLFDRILSLLDALLGLLDDAVDDHALGALLQGGDGRLELLVRLRQATPHLLDLVLAEALRPVLVVQEAAGGLERHRRLRRVGLPLLPALLGRLAVRLLGIGLGLVGHSGDLLLGGDDLRRGVLDHPLGGEPLLHAAAELLVLRHVGRRPAEPGLVLDQLLAHLRRHLLALGLDLPGGDELPRVRQRRVCHLLGRQRLLARRADVRRRHLQELRVVREDAGRLADGLGQTFRFGHLGLGLPHRGGLFSDCRRFL
mmetsp:Transcript_102600/g.313756  ORF Transcript_102600/g.313756 Transcript_102600/m.313756 type:complete len:677 (-) Transcript_102600:1987-4017(-)